MKLTLPILAAFTLSSYSASAHSHSPHNHRRHAEIAQQKMVRRQVELKMTASTKSERATVGDIVAAHNYTQSGGSPYNIAGALADLASSNNVQLVKKRGQTASATTNSTSGDDGQCEEKNGDDDEEQCEDDQDSEDDEDCDDDGSDDEDDEDCNDGQSGSSGVDASVSLSANSTSAVQDAQDLADGSLTAAEGCSAFATVVAGDSCYRLLSDDSLLPEFYKNNPSVTSDCGNLVIGKSYCVATGGAASPSASAASSPTPSSSANSSPASSSSSTAPSSYVEDAKAAAATVSASVQVQVNVQDQPSSSSSSKLAAPSSNGGNSGGVPVKKDFTGMATFYYQKGNAGACGKYNSDSAYIVALYPSVYQNGARCGDKVSLTNNKTGKTVEAVVADLCPSCEGAGHIDLSDGLFKALGNGADGTFPISFGFI